MNQDNALMNKVTVEWLGAERMCFVTNDVGSIQLGLLAFIN